ncbi:MAG: amidohydrolase family protein [Fimbriimonadaceae bacterium]|nr:amidohydrolase family protein [Fimbriimonadaceae bacterium]QYK55232.1 MAG: amidohydrolase family protein [Fimbriimonadaceae bacterium]
MEKVIRSLFTSVALLTISAASPSQTSPRQAPASVLFTDVRVFDGKADRLSGPTNVLVVGNKIASIGAGAGPGDGTVVIAGAGKTLMPGLIDAHVHMMFSMVPQMALATTDLAYAGIAAAQGSEEMLMRGFTSVRDLGGPVFGLKKAIDQGLAIGPRIYPSGAFISQTGGHGDFRLPVEMPAETGVMSYAERVGATAIADDEGTVRKRARELLALGASQLKVMAGGGVSSNYDPLDVTQYTEAELRAAVEAAENWGTYVTVHAYTPRSVRQAIAAGVKCIDHGQLLDEPTVKLMAEKGVWWSLQPFTDDRPSGFAEGSENRRKQLEVATGTDAAYRLAKKHGVKTAWGTDNLFSAVNSRLQSNMLAQMTRWFTPAETLRMATSVNAELLALSGPRNPYPGKLGVVEEGALADLILVDGDPLANFDLVKDPAKNFIVIMKDGRIFKNALR